MIIIWKVIYATSMRALYQASLETRRSSGYHAQEREGDLGQLWQVCPCGRMGELADEGRRCNVGFVVAVILKALLSLSVSLGVVPDPAFLCLAPVKLHKRALL